jgi:hypothetical protein
VLRVGINDNGAGFVGSGHLFVKQGKCYLKEASEAREEEEEREARE